MAIPAGIEPATAP